MSRFMSVRELAKTLRVSDHTVRRWITAGNIKPENVYRVDGSRKLLVDAAAQWPDMFGEEEKHE